MNQIENALAFTASTLLTLVGFDLMVTPAVGILKIGRLAGDRMISVYLAGGGAGPSRMALTGSVLDIPILIILGLAVRAWFASLATEEEPDEGRTKKGSGRGLDGRSSGLGNLRISGSAIRP